MPHASAPFWPPRHILNDDVVHVIAQVALPRLQMDVAQREVDNVLDAAGAAGCVV